MIESYFRVGFIVSQQSSMLPFAEFLDVVRHAADEANHTLHHAGY